MREAEDVDEGCITGVLVTRDQLRSTTKRADERICGLTEMERKRLNGLEVEVQSVQGKNILVELEEWRIGAKEREMKVVVELEMLIGEVRTTERMLEGKNGVR